MRTIVLQQTFHQHGAPPVSGETPAPPRKGILRPIFAAIERSRQRHAEQAVANFIAARGGRLTDDVERQLTEHFIGRGLTPYEPPRSFGPFRHGG